MDSVTVVVVNKPDWILALEWIGSFLIACMILTIMLEILEAKHGFISVLREKIW